MFLPEQSWPTLCVMLVYISSTTTETLSLMSCFQNEWRLCDSWKPIKLLHFQVSMPVSHSEVASLLVLEKVAAFSVILSFSTKVSLYAWLILRNKKNSRSWNSAGWLNCYKRFYSSNLFEYVLNYSTRQKVLPSLLVKNWLLQRKIGQNWGESLKH